jgi:hypothetical protein
VAGSQMQQAQTQAAGSQIEQAAHPMQQATCRGLPRLVSFGMAQPLQGRHRQQ